MYVHVVIGSHLQLLLNAEFTSGNCDNAFSKTAILWQYLVEYLRWPMLMWIKEIVAAITSNFLLTLHCNDNIPVSPIVVWLSRV